MVDSLIPAMMSRNFLVAACSSIKLGILSLSSKKKKKSRKKIIEAEKRLLPENFSLILIGINY